MKVTVVIAILSALILRFECQTIAHSDLKCIRETNDNTTCFFSYLTDPWKFYQNLNTMNDTKKKEITKIYFKDCELYNIPKELTVHFSNVITLDASALRLKRLESYDFNSGAKIQYLNVSLNYISSLTKQGLPDFMNKVINLDMSHNVIDRIDDDVFSVNTNLKFLNLSSNRIGKFGIDFLNSLKNLEVLKLDNNRITVIHGDAEDLMMKLKELHLQNNNLKSFSPSIIPSAVYLDLSHNNLEEDLDFSANKLIDLKVSHNLLQSLKINRNLMSLDASSNEDSSFKVDFNGNKALTRLSLSNLEVPSFTKILTDIQQLSNLTFLDLSKNTIETLDFNKAKLGKSLEFLDISRCEIHALSGWENLASFLPNLKSIDIRGNFLHCDDMRKIVDKLKNTNVLIGLNNTEENDFINKNCASDHHKHKEKRAQEPAGGQNKALWALLIIMMLGYVFGILYFVNKRYNIVDVIVQRTTGNGFVRQEFTNC